VKSVLIALLLGRFKYATVILLSPHIASTFIGLDLWIIAFCNKIASN
jgi:hypothetical protein